MLFFAFLMSFVMSAIVDCRLPSTMTLLHLYIMGNSEGHCQGLATPFAGTRCPNILELRRTCPRAEDPGRRVGGDRRQRDEQAQGS